MSIYHQSVKVISRKAGRSATAAIAYRTASKITCLFTGQVFDYSKKKGVVYDEIFLPEGAGAWASDREILWNCAELAEKRKDATTAKEIVLALPSELNLKQQKELLSKYCKEIAKKDNCAIDAVIHEPNVQGDDRNFHAHLMKTTRTPEAEGFSVQKIASERNQDFANRQSHLKNQRKLWETFCNAALKEAGCSERVSCESLKNQGIDRTPQIHIGVDAVGFERRTGEKSNRRAAWEEQVKAEQADFERLTPPVPPKTKPKAKPPALIIRDSRKKTTSKPPPVQPTKPAIEPPQPATPPEQVKSTSRAIDVLGQLEMMKSRTLRPK